MVCLDYLRFDSFLNKPELKEHPLKFDLHRAYSFEVHQTQSEADQLQLLYLNIDHPELYDLDGLLNLVYTQIHHQGQNECQIIRYSDP